MRRAYIESLFYYLFGFTIGRFLEYPIKWVVTLLFIFLGKPIGMFESESEFQEALKEFSSIVWLEYAALLQQGFHWALWLGAGFSGWLVHLWCLRLDESQAKVVRGFSVPVIVILIHAVQVAVRGFPYGHPFADFLMLPTMIVIQFYVSLSMMKLSPFVLAFLHSVRVEDLLASLRWRKGKRGTIK